MTTYTIETRLADGTVIDTIATGLTAGNVGPLIEGCLAERREAGGDGIVGILQVREDGPDDPTDRPFFSTLADFLNIWVIVPDGRKGEVIAVDLNPGVRTLTVRFGDGSTAGYYVDQVEPA